MLLKVFDLAEQVPTFAELPLVSRRNKSLWLSPLLG